MGRIRARARLVTSHPVSAYGGTQLDEAVVGAVAEAVASGELPMHFEHDITRPLDIANVVAGTERLPDGHLAAWAEFDVDEEAWTSFQAELSERGAPGGMSVSLTAPLEGGSSAANSFIVVAADAHHFTDDEIATAAFRLKSLHESASGERLYQFSFTPEALVIIDMALMGLASVPWNIVSSMIYDAARSFVAPPREHAVLDLVFRESPRGARKIKVRIKVSNDAELKAALGSLTDVLKAGTAGTFKSTAGAPIVAINEDGLPRRERPRGQA